MFRLIADHEEFEFTLRERQSDVDDATKGRKKPINDDGVITKSGRKLVPKYDILRRQSFSFFFRYILSEDRRNGLD